MELAHCSVKLLLFCLVTWRDWGSARHVASPSGAINVMLFGIDVRITPEASCCGRCNEDTPFRQVYVTCYCDKFCLTYQDCCLDYELYCTNLEERLIKDRDHELLEAFQNCSKSMETLATPGIAPSNSSANDRDLCLIWYPERAQSLVDEFACKMEALWVPVILARKPNRTLVRALVQSFSDHVLLVQDCVQNANTVDTIDLCMSTAFDGFESLMDVEKVVPVTAHDGLHYRNLYCARCNGIEDKDVQFWQIKLTCPSQVRHVGLTDSSVSRCWFESVIVPSLFRWRTAQPRIIPANLVSRACGSSVQSKGEFEDACRAYQLKTPCAKNPHCESGCECSGLPCLTPPEIQSSDRPIFLPISAVFHFTLHGGMRYSLEGDPAVKVCDDEYEFFDSALGACRPFLCPSGQSPGPRGSCVVVDSMRNPCLQSDLDEPQLISVQMDFRVKSVGSAKVYMMSLSRRLLNISLEEFDQFDCNAPLSTVDAIPVALTTCRLSFVTFSTLSFEETLLGFLTQMRTDPAGIGKTFRRTGFRFDKLSLKNYASHRFLVEKCGRFGGMPVAYSRGVDYRRFEVNGSAFVDVTVGNETLLCPGHRLYQKVVFRPSKFVGHSQEFMFLCQTKLSCPLVIFNSSEYSWLDNTTISIGSGRNISSDEVIQLSNKNVVLCRPRDCSNCTQPSILGDAVLSMICISVSQLFLLLCLLSFCFLPELWTLPGKNLFCSILALFLTQTVFLIGPGSPLSQFTVASDKDVCLAFAVLIHYFLLATFFWINVVSLHFARTFGFKLRMRSVRFRRAFRWYSLYGWGTPGVIAGVWLVVHKLILEGGHGLVIYQHCLPFGVGAVLLVAAPMSLLLVLNAALFVLTVVGIRRTKQSTSVVMQEQRTLEHLQSEVTLCTKIFVATGMSWILIFILGYVDVEGFSYFFTVLIAIQGPLLFFSFAFTERVRAMWRVRITRLLQAQTDTLEEASDTRKSALQGSRVADTEMDLLYQSKPSESEERA
ncbi:uncharacterized protein LOC110979342 isoform X1 [Acanthaster planci]|uniref:Uncharacterized protein LOC110979342 isoform X1 n=1 Tax=Acanthaster planci TaxID=133434 RepID=A0A8B7YBW7_ACAPL|nr:uncharacterized protein LOC110979342 isoform X1 [Acanthaster planci]